MEETEVEELAKLLKALGSLTDSLWFTDSVSARHRKTSSVSATAAMSIRPSFPVT